MMRRNEERQLVWVCIIGALHHYYDGVVSTYSAEWLCAVA